MVVATQEELGRPQVMTALDDLVSREASGVLEVTGSPSGAVYLDGGRGCWHQRRRRQLFAWAAAHGRKLMVSEGQAEPWETATVPPNPGGGGMYSCLPEQVIENYNQCMRWQQQEASHLYAYVFWGAEYWVVRDASGDPRYLRAFARILERA